MPVEFDSPYQKLWESGLVQRDAKIVIEVGVNDGRGILALREYFSEAKIFAIEENVRDEIYKTSLEELAKIAQDKATLIIERSPLSFSWPLNYDFCGIDLGADPEINFNNIRYWLSYKKPNGVLAIVVPRSTPEKIAKKEQLIGQLRAHGMPYQEIYNWFVFC